MATSTNDIRNGMVLVFNNEPWQVVEFLHVKPGKGGAFVRTKLKNVKTGKVVDNTFRAGAPIDTVKVERRPMQFLYEDESGLHFMDTESYDQTVLRADLVPGRKFVKEGGMVDVLFDASTDTPLNSEIQRHAELAVTQTDPGIRGDTATGATKPATLESGAVVNVPLFINEGDVIRVDTEDGSYLTRVSAAG
jgi:elongation factor P